MSAPPFAATPRQLDALVRRACAEATGIPAGEMPDTPVRRSAAAPGEYTSALPPRLAGRAGRDARGLAADVAAALRRRPHLADARVDGPGFVAFTPVPAVRTALVQVAADAPARHLLDLPPRPRPARRPAPVPGWTLSDLGRAHDATRLRDLARADARRRIAAAVAAATAADVADLLADQPAADWRDVPGDARGDEAARLLAVTGEAAARVAACRGATEVPRPHETTGPRLPARPTPDHPGEWARATFANPAFVLRHAHAHARTAHERWAADLGLRRLGGGRAHTAAEVAALTEPAAEAVLGALFDGPAALRAAARRHQPHILVRYLEGLAAAYHDWWESHDVLSGRADAADDRAGTAAARLDVCAAVAGVLHAGLSLIGVSAPTRL